MTNVSVFCFFARCLESCCYNLKNTNVFVAESNDSRYDDDEVDADVDDSIEFEDYDGEKETPTPSKLSKSLKASSRSSYASPMPSHRHSSRSAKAVSAVQRRSKVHRLSRSALTLPASGKRSTSHKISRTAMSRSASKGTSTACHAERSHAGESRSGRSHAGKKGSYRMIGNVYEDSETSSGDEVDTEKDNEESELSENIEDADDAKDAEEDEESEIHESPRGKSRRSITSYVSYSDDEPDISDDEESDYPTSMTTRKLRGTSRTQSSKSRVTKRSPQPQARRSYKSSGFTAPQAQRRPARDSGCRIPPSRNMTPERIDVESVVEARRLQKGGPRRASVNAPRRAHGANDPENILIVNLKENEGMRWEEIAKRLNDNRIATGMKPDLTANSVHNRYNRNAPILFAAEGKEFIPIKERRPGYKTSSAWNPERDQALIDAVRSQEESKWFSIAQIYSERMGHVIDAQTAAYRFSLI